MDKGEEGCPGPTQGAMTENVTASDRENNGLQQE